MVSLTDDAAEQNLIIYAILHIKSSEKSFTNLDETEIVLPNMTNTHRTPSGLMQ